MKLKKHWYKISIFTCPVCGSERIYRERVYGEKPKNSSERYNYVCEYDWCQEYPMGYF